MYDPANGPPYDAAFVERYRAAQVARNDRLTDWCIDEIARLESHGMSDELFVIRGVWADPRFLDPALDPSPRRTPWSYAGDPQRANEGVFGIGTVSTLRSWLNMWSLRESDCRGGPHLARLDLPTLLIQPDADNGVFPSQAVEIFEAVASTGQGDGHDARRPLLPDARRRPRRRRRRHRRLARHGTEPVSDAPRSRSSGTETPENRPVRGRRRPRRRRRRWGGRRRTWGRG